MVNNALVRFCYGYQNRYVNEPDGANTIWDCLKAEIQSYNNKFCHGEYDAVLENWGINISNLSFPTSLKEEELQETQHLKEKIMKNITEIEKNFEMPIKFSFDAQNKIILDKNIVDVLNKLEKESDGLGNLIILNKIQKAIDDCNNNDGQYQICDPRLEDEIGDFHKGDLNEIFEGMDYYGNEFCLSPLPKIVIEKDENGKYKMPDWVVQIQMALKTKYQDTVNVLNDFNVFDKQKRDELRHAIDQNQITVQDYQNFFEEQRESKFKKWKESNQEEFKKWKENILNPQPINTKARKPSQMPVKTVVTGKTNELTR